MITRDKQSPQTIAAYMRVSTEEQVDGFSLDAQRHELTQAFASRPHEQWLEYTDAGKSAKSISGRPALQRLIGDAKKGRVQQVVVLRLNRLTRNLKDLLTILQIFQDHDVELFSVHEEIDMNSTMGKITLQMIGAVAELERAQIAENVKMSMQQWQRAGNWNAGNNVLGYQWDIESKTVSVVPEEADIVMQIFDWYVQGLGYKAIANRLNERGTKTKKGTAFHINSVRSILQNVNYIGKIRYDSAGVEGNTISKETTGPQQAIVDNDVWQQAQGRLQTNTKTETTNTRHYWLTGLLKCPQCQGPMISRRMNRVRKTLGKTDTYHYYTCATYQNVGASACKSNLISADEMETWFFEQLQELFTKPKWLTAILSWVNRKIDLAQPNPVEVHEWKAKLLELEDQQKKLYQAFESEQIDDEVFIQHIQQLMQEKEYANKQYLQLQSKYAEMSIPKLTEEQVRSILRQLREVMKMATMDEQKRWFQLLIEKITVPEDRNIQGAMIHFKTSWDIQKEKQGREEQII